MILSGDAHLENASVDWESDDFLLQEAFTSDFLRRIVLLNSDHLTLKFSFFDASHEMTQ